MFFCCACGTETPYWVCVACQTAPLGSLPPAGRERCCRWLYCPHDVSIGQRCPQCPEGISEGFQEMGAK